MRPLAENSSESALPGLGSEKPLAVFDFDGTLVRGDSFLPFLTAYARSRQRYWPLLTMPFWLSLYATRLLTDAQAKQRLLVSFFRGESKEAVATFVTLFYERWVRPRLHNPVFARLQWHLAEGHRVVMLSASPSLYICPFGRALGIDEIVCTQVRMHLDRWDGALDGPNCKGEQKLVLLRAHLGTHHWDGASFAYGDSHSDLPVLNWVTNGYLVGRGGRLSRVGNPALASV